MSNNTISYDINLSSYPEAEENIDIVLGDEGDSKIVEFLGDKYWITYISGDYECYDSDMVATLINVKNGDEIELEMKSNYDTLMRINVQDIGWVSGQDIDWDNDSIAEMVYKWVRLAEKIYIDKEYVVQKFVIA